MKILALYGIAIAIFFALDMLWLGLIARNFYRQKLGFIFTGDVDWIAAVVFYLIYIGGILYFAILPGFKVESWQIALINGALFGFICYATYDFTNKATIAQWPWIVVIADVIWGAALTGSVSVCTYLIGSKFY